MNTKETRIENGFYNDKTKQMKFITRKDPYKSLAELLGERYVQYRKKWVETSSGKDMLNFPLHLDMAINDACNIKCHFCPHYLTDDERGYKLGGGGDSSFRYLYKNY